MVTITEEKKEIKSDVNTVLLDHFSVKGKIFGAVQYKDSIKTLGNSIMLTKGAYIKYALEPWYIWDGVHNWNRNEAASGAATQGTIEMWIYPLQHPCGILNFNWNDTKVYPDAGHIMHLSLNAQGKLTYGVWGGHSDKDVTGKKLIRRNEWWHIAVSWSPKGTRLYVNGSIDVQLPENFWPAFQKGLFFAYLNYWGGNDLGLIDELCISKNAKSSSEIQSHASR